MQELKLTLDDLQLLARDLAALGGAVCFEAQSRGLSMTPHIRDGDTLRIRTTGGEALATGDIAVYSNERGEAVAHRVLGRRETPAGVILLIRGDSLAEGMEDVPAARVFGQVVEIRRGGKVILVAEPGERARALRSLARRSLGRELGWRGLGRRCAAWVQGRPVYRVWWGRWVGVLVREEDGAALEDAGLRRLLGALRPEHGWGGLSRLAESLQTGDARLVVARRGPDAVGCAVVGRDPDAESPGVWRLYGPNVRVRWRGAGVGRKLAGMALELAVRSRAAEVHAAAEHGSVPVARIMQDLGFAALDVGAVASGPDRYVWRGERPGPGADQ